MFYYGLLLLVTLVLYGLKDTALVSHIWTYQKDYVGASSGFLCPSRPWVGGGRNPKPGTNMQVVVEGLGEILRNIPKAVSYLQSRIQ